MVTATWTSVVLLELIHAPKPNFAEGLYLLDPIHGSLRLVVVIQMPHKKSADAKKAYVGAETQRC